MLPSRRTHQGKLAKKGKHCPATSTGVCPAKETVVVKCDDDSSEEKLKVAEMNKTIVHKTNKATPKTKQQHLLMKHCLKNKQQQHQKVGKQQQ